MKRMLFAAMLVTVAQAGMAQKFAFGLKAGLNLANQSLTANGASASFSNYVAYHGGLFTIFSISDRFGIQPELVYSAQGWDFDFNFMGAGLAANLRADYLTVPVMFRYNANSIFHLDAGPQLGFLLSAKGTANGVVQDVKSDYASSDFGLAFGMGVDLPAKVLFSFRYYTGLTDADNYAASVSKNTNIQFSVGYKFISK